MNKEIDALVAKCCIGGTDGNYAYADRVRDALMEARALGLEEAAKVCKERADRANGAQYKLSAYDCESAIRALKGE